MYNSKYYTCEQIDQRLLEGYYDDAVAAGYTGSKSQYLAGLLRAINYSANPTITADKVVYNPAISGLTSKNVKAAIDELANKKANTADVDTKFTEEKNRVDAELAKKFDNDSVVQELGDAEDKVMSQKATTTAIAYETTRAKAAEEAIIFDVSAHNDGAVFESISALLGDANLSTLIPTSVRRGGMSIRFIQGSEQSSDNKYVQYRLVKNAWSTSVNDWQGVDDEPIFGSENLVKSGGVKEVIYKSIGEYKDLTELSVTKFKGIAENGDIVSVGGTRHNIKTFNISSIPNIKLTTMFSSYKENEPLLPWAIYSSEDTIDNTTMIAHGEAISQKNYIKEINDIITVSEVAKILIVGFIASEEEVVSVKGHYSYFDTVELECKNYIDGRIGDSSQLPGESENIIEGINYVYEHATDEVVKVVDEVEKLTLDVADITGQTAYTNYVIGVNGNMVFDKDCMINKYEIPEDIIKVDIETKIAMGPRKRQLFPWAIYSSEDVFDSTTMIAHGEVVSSSDPVDISNSIKCAGAKVLFVGWNRNKDWTIQPTVIAYAPIKGELPDMKLKIENNENKLKATNVVRNLFNMCVPTFRDSKGGFNQDNTYEHFLTARKCGVMIQKLDTVLTTDEHFFVHHTYDGTSTIQVNPSTKRIVDGIFTTPDSDMIEIKWRDMTLAECLEYHYHIYGEDFHGVSLDDALITLKRDSIIPYITFRKMNGKENIMAAELARVLKKHRLDTSVIVNLYPYTKANAIAIRDSLPDVFINYTKSDNEVLTIEDIDTFLSIAGQNAIINFWCKDVENYEANLNAIQYCITNGIFWSCDGIDEDLFEHLAPIRKEWSYIKTFKVYEYKIRFSIINGDVKFIPFKEYPNYVADIEVNGDYIYISHVTNGKEHLPYRIPNSWISEYPCTIECYDKNVECYVDKENYRFVLNKTGGIPNGIYTITIKI